MAVTRVEGRRVIDAAVAKATEMGIAVAVAVVNPRGDLVVLERMDEAGFPTPAFASGKAQVSAMMGTPSGAHQDAAETYVYQTINRIAGGGMAFIQGAVPLIRNGKVIGAVGASGALPEQDEEVAEAGATAL
jgi:glc operon protein GlcG